MENIPFQNHKKKNFVSKLLLITPRRFFNEIPVFSIPLQCQSFKLIFSDVKRQYRAQISRRKNFFIPRKKNPLT